MHAWCPRVMPQYDDERVPQYGELSTTCLTKTLQAAAEEKARRAEEKAKFDARQEALKSVAKADVEYLKGLRKIDLEGVSHRVEEKKQQDKQKEHDTIMKTVKEQDLARLKAATFNEREQRRKNNELDYYGREMTRFAKDHQERDAIEAKHKADREAKAMETLKQIRAKEEAQQKAAKAFAKKSKLQLAQETKKQHVHEEKKQAKRDKEGSQGRIGNVNYMKTHSDRLHWEPPPSPVHIAQYAKEIRERAEGPTGGK